MPAEAGIQVFCVDKEGRFPKKGSVPVGSFRFLMVSELVQFHQRP